MDDYIINAIRTKTTHNTQYGTTEQAVKRVDYW